MAKIEMKNWIKRMVEEHAKVVVEIDKYSSFLDNTISDDKTNKATVANIALLVRDLKNLAKDYEVILHNENIEFTSEGEYYIKLAHIEETKSEDNHEQDN